ncbi:hypothetical protein GCM10009777_11310 [Microbacterium pumilum]|uniref:Polyketide cyclase n=2 Tax=Microbacterium pumilum TaxID=344165 RepID=A0ABP5DIX9_9MICO
MDPHGFVVTRGIVPTWPGMTPAGQVVARFLATVRQSGDPDDAIAVLAPRVTAHQMSSHRADTIVRTPEEYAAHIGELLRMYGPFRFEVTEILSQDDRVFVRWVQRGHHIRRVDGSSGTGRPLIDVASAVYRVEQDRIAEYWIQSDTQGLVCQLDALERWREE